MVGHNLQRGRSREKVPAIAERQQKYAHRPRKFPGQFSPETYLLRIAATKRGTGRRKPGPHTPVEIASGREEVVNVADFPRNRRWRQAAQEQLSVRP